MGLNHEESDKERLFVDWLGIYDGIIGARKTLSVAKLQACKCCLALLARHPPNYCNFRVTTTKKGEIILYSTGVWYSALLKAMNVFLWEFI